MRILYPDHPLEQHSPSPKLGKLLSDKEGNKAHVDLKCKLKGKGSAAKASWKERLWPTRALKSSQRLQEA